MDHIVKNLTKTNQKEAENNDTDLPENLYKKLSNLGTNDNTNKTPQTSLVEELSSVTNNTAIKTPVYEDKITTTGPNSFYTLKIYLPLVESLTECKLNVDSARKNIVLDSKVYKQLEIPFKYLEESFYVDLDLIQAKFVNKEKILKIKIPLKPK